MCLRTARGSEAEDATRPAAAAHSAPGRPPTVEPGPRSRGVPAMCSPPGHVLAPRPGARDRAGRAPSPSHLVREPHPGFWAVHACVHLISLFFLIKRDNP